MRTLLIVSTLALAACSQRAEIDNLQNTLNGMDNEVRELRNQVNGSTETKNVAVDDSQIQQERYQWRLARLRLRQQHILDANVHRLADVYHSYPTSRLLTARAYLMRICQGSGDPGDSCNYIDVIDRELHNRNFELTN